MVFRKYLVKVGNFYYRTFSINLDKNMLTNVEDNKLSTFTNICDKIANESSYISKAEILNRFFRNGNCGNGFRGDLLLWVSLLIPGSSQRVYNLQNKQMLKLFSRIFACNVQDMQLDLEQEGDVSETLRKFFEQSHGVMCQKKSTLFLHEVDSFLQNLEQKTKENEQIELLKKLCSQSTSVDLKTIIRLIKQDLRINAGARHIFDAFGTDAYSAYQASRNIKSVVEQYQSVFLPSNSKEVSYSKKGARKKGTSIQVMTPISPMLASACKSIDDAFKKSPSGLYCEIKYDGERVQIHKCGNEFRFFSRNLKPVMDHKVKSFKEHIPKAFPYGGDLILDSEIIMVDWNTGNLLPFGSLGAHKKKEYDNAQACLFIFDCILFDGEDITQLSFKERRSILENKIVLLDKSHIKLSECHFIRTKNELSIMTAKVLKANLEGVVLKTPHDGYQPGKRHWMKVKKDYLFGGKMADSADLVVLGGWFGSGKKGGILSIFLMGCFDPRDHLWKTVTKVHSGLDDGTNDEIHKSLLKIMERSEMNLPNWLLCKNSLIPDFIAKNPNVMPVWEITGAEFTKSEAHTASGISIRFPRITKLRDDKSTEDATDLRQLERLYEASKANVNVDLLLEDCNIEEDRVTINSKLILNSDNPTLKLEQDNGINNSLYSIEKKGKKRSSDQLSNELTIAKKPKTDVNSSPKQKQLMTNYFKTSKNNVPDNYSNTDLKCKSNLFNKIIGYFASEQIDEDIKAKFLSNNGQIASSSIDANFVFHCSLSANPDLNVVRRKYLRRCRHLQSSWIEDSIKSNSCQPYDQYAVYLKQ